MPRYKSDISTIYISERLQEAVRRVTDSKFTTVIAPMGYGKTTLVNWILDQRRRAGARILYMNVYSSDIRLFWKRFQDAFRGTALEEALQKLEMPVSPAAVAVLKDLLEDYFTETDEEHYIFIDDYHLMEDSRVTKLLLDLVRTPTEHDHVIIASRDTFLSRGEEMQLGRDLLKITVSDLRLNPTELSIYSHRCGLNLSEEELSALNELSEGWFSAIYLNFCSYQEHHRLLTESHDIYEMMNTTLLESLSAEESEFLTKMCVTDEFSIEEAEFITELPDCAAIAEGLTQHNAFVRLLSDGVTYRFHHMLKDCMERRFSMLPREQREAVYLRCGRWHESVFEYLPALHCYRLAGAHADILRLVGVDRGVQLASLSADVFLSWLRERTDEELMAEPRGLLVLMRRLFTWKQIPEMLRIKDLLLRAVEENDLSEEERCNLRGECDLIMSFLGYNDIAAMSRLHRSACRQMTRPSISIAVHGTYTFGCPSVLMMFHREAGALEQEIAVMNESMPYYYQVTRRHGAGAEKIMEAEGRFVCGDYLDARIMLEKASQEARDYEQHYILLCCDMLSLRLALCGEAEFDNQWYTRKQALLWKRYDPLLLTVLDGCFAYFCAVLGDVESIPDWIAKGHLDEVNLLDPARVMYEMIYSQVLLARGKYLEVVGRSEKLLRSADHFPYTLCTLHLRIQTAAALYALGKTEDAGGELRRALAIAEPDGILQPFVENYRNIEQCLRGCAEGAFADAIHAAAKKAEPARKALLAQETRGPFRDLTDTEYRMCQLVADKKTNREIAEELFLSEGSVKQYLNRIYAKLGIVGNVREKRASISAMLHKN